MTIWIIIAILVALSLTLSVVTVSFVGNLTTDAQCLCVGQLPDEIPWYYLHKLCNLTIILEDRLQAGIDIQQDVLLGLRLAQKLVSSDVQGVLKQQYGLVDKFRDLQLMLNSRVNTSDLLNQVKLIRKNIKLSCFKSL